MPVEGVHWDMYSTLRRDDKIEEGCILEQPLLGRIRVGDGKEQEDEEEQLLEIVT